MAFLKMNLKTLNLQISSFFQVLGKILGSYQLGKVNDKIPGFQSFPGRVGTL